MEEHLLKRIKEFRLNKRLTALEVSQKMGFNSQNGYTKLELGTTELKVSHLYKLAEIFEISIGELMGLSENRSGLDQKRIIELEEKLYALEVAVVTLSKQLSYYTESSLNTRLAHFSLEFHRKKLELNENEYFGDIQKIFFTKRIFTYPSEFPDLYKAFFSLPDIKEVFEKSEIYHLVWKKLWELHITGGDWNQAPPIKMPSIY